MPVFGIPQTGRPGVLQPALALVIRGLRRARAGAAVALAIIVLLPPPGRTITPGEQVGGLVEHVLEEVGLAGAEERERLARVADERTHDPTHLCADQSEHEHPDAKDG